MLNIFWASRHENARLLALGSAEVSLDLGVEAVASAGVAGVQGVKGEIVESEGETFLRAFLVTISIEVVVNIFRCSNPAVGF